MDNQAKTKIEIALRKLPNGQNLAALFHKGHYTLVYSELSRNEIGNPSAVQLALQHYLDFRRIMGRL
jgi:hypothetical protein